MRLPVIQGLIDRRILVNFRIAPDILAAVLPEPYRPCTVNGYGIAGICLIRLKQIRPALLPGFVGIGSENAAHRIAVEWEEHGVLREGVYIPRRDTSSRLNALAGGRLFPGFQGHARFKVDERDGCFDIEVTGEDGFLVTIRARLAAELGGDSLFGSIKNASEFFKRGSVGYSPSARAQEFDGLELRLREWSLEPLVVDKVASSYFDNEQVFPPGSVEFDSAFLMRDVPHEWRSRPPISGAKNPRASSAYISDCT